MKLVRTINSWTCLPAAIATQFNCTLQQLFDILGHDGSEIVRKGEDPQRRRGFHPQEFFELFLQSGYSVTQIDLFPTAQPNLKADICLFETVLGENCEKRFYRHLLNSFGWIDCKTRHGTGHALAYEYATIGDPATGEVFQFQSKQDSESRGIYFVSMFRLDSWGSLE